MVEVLVTLFILTIGLLGMAYLQVIGLHFEQNSQVRNRTTQIADDLIDRMRANGVGPTDPDATDYTSARSTDIACDPKSAGVINAKQCFYAALDAIPGGFGKITTAGSTYRITVVWLDRRAEKNKHINSPAKCQTAGRVWSTALTWIPSSRTPSTPTCLLTKTWVVQL